MTYARRFDHTVINENLETAIEETTTLVREFLNN